MLLKLIHRYGEKQHKAGIQRCEDFCAAALYEDAPRNLRETTKGRIQNIIATNRLDRSKKNILDVGCGDGSLFERYVKTYENYNWHGIEGNEKLADIAQKKGIKVVSCDLNGPLPFESNFFDLILASQVIEHTHNTRAFVSELYRILAPGGKAALATENLASLLNILALTCGYAPFSLMQVCGIYIGNPIGLHQGETTVSYSDRMNPKYSGIAGHNRVMTVRQMKELFQLEGFIDVSVKSISVLPFPDSVSRIIERLIRHKGHFIVMWAQKGAQEGPS